LTCALRLCEAEIAVTLVEAEAAVPTELRASTWHPPTLEMLQPYGLADQLIAQGLVTPTWQTRLHNTGERAVFDLGVLADDTPYPFRLQCEQSRLGELIVDRLKGNPYADLRFATRLVDFEQRSDGVTAVIGRGTEEERLEADWLIGADGARSTVRERLDVALQGQTYPETTILATTRFAFHEHLEGLSNVNYVWADWGTYSLLRLPGVWRASLYPDTGESIEDAAMPDAIQRKLQRIVPKDGPFEVLEVRPYRVHQRIVDEYRHGRVVLAGDAAHLNSPSGGMGMNGGIHDAFNLTDKLTGVLRGAPDELIDLYGRQRRPVALDAILKQADRNRNRMQERDPEQRRKALADLQAIVADPARARSYLLGSSMIAGLRLAAAIQ
jgi:3-(3-hydroxy-phenyl)propionate hydroxylase